MPIKKLAVAGVLGLVAMLVPAVNAGAASGG